MTGEDRTWQSAPPFDHIVVGLPSEVVEAEDAPSAPASKRRRAGLAVGITAVLLAGGLGGANAVQQNMQTPGAKVLAEVSRADLQEAAELEAALAELEELLETARDARDAAQDILGESDADLLQELDGAIAAAEQLLELDGDAAELELVTTAAANLESATDAVEAAATHEARETLSTALVEAGAALDQSAGRVLDEQVRADLDVAIEDAQAALESDTEPARALVDRARQLDERAEAVAEAVAIFEQEQARLVEPPEIPAPVIEPPSSNNPPSITPPRTPPSAPSPTPGRPEPTPTPAPPPPAPTQPPAPPPTDPPGDEPPADPPEDSADER